MKLGASNRRSAASRLRLLFYRTPSELRAGWRLGLFVLIVAVLMIAKSFLLGMLPHGTGQAAAYVFDKSLKFGVFLSASWVMAKIEARTIADYGLPWREILGRHFWRGAALAFLGLTVFLAMAKVGSLFRFGGIALRGADIWKWGCLYGLGFIIVALEEEFHYRGYGLYTLTQGIGFWPAAILSSAVFGYSHIANSGENLLGIFNAGAGGLLFCLLLRRSGTLWLPIGFHASWDWTQSYFYGIPDSGQVLPSHLLNGNFVGPVWLTGGTVGPEGSILLTLLLVLFSLCVFPFFREARYPCANRLQP